MLERKIVEGKFSAVHKTVGVVQYKIHKTVNSSGRRGWGAELRLSSSSSCCSGIFATDDPCRLPWNPKKAQRAPQPETDLSSAAHCLKTPEKHLLQTAHVH